MSKVYVVLSCDFDEIDETLMLVDIDGVFDSKDKAIGHINKKCERYIVTYDPKQESYSYNAGYADIVIYIRESEIQ